MGLAPLTPKLFGFPAMGLPKVILPHAVDEGAGGEWVFRMGNPLCEGEATAVHFIGDFVGIVFAGTFGGRLRVR